VHNSVACVPTQMNVNVQLQCSVAGLHVVLVAVARSVLTVFDKLSFTPLFSWLNNGSVTELQCLSTLITCCAVCSTNNS